LKIALDGATRAARGYPAQVKEVATSPMPREHSAMAAHALSAHATSSRRWIPNALTVLRLIIAVAFFALLSVWTYPASDLVVSPRVPVLPYLIAAALFGLAAITDAVDGPLARRWKVVSTFGRVMDPFADKVLVVGAFVMLAGPRFAVDVPGHRDLQVSGVMPWMVVLILGRELLVTSIRAVLESEGKDFSATWSGKAKMVLQACVIPFVLVLLGITEVHRGSWGRWVIDISIWLTVAVTVVSGVPYVTRGIAAFRSPTTPTR
jgi:CDP-diacylglycerol--glycerol-3-phosphate 3-phosphatidyltransferase